MTTTLRSLTSQFTARRARAEVSSRNSVASGRRAHRTTTAAGRSRVRSTAVNGGVGGLTPLADSMPLRTR